MVTDGIVIVERSFNKYFLNSYKSIGYEVKVVCSSLVI